MKIVITGAFGNIGQKVINILLAKQHELICFDLDNPTNRKAAEKFSATTHIVWGDITNQTQVNDVIADADAVIHMAALLPAVVNKNPALGEKVNIGGTQNVINAIAQSAKAPQLIFCSSVSVHGNRLPSAVHPITVDEPFNPGDTYAGHKIACEQLIRAATINATVVRIGACVDADSKLAGKLADMIRFLLSVNVNCRLEYIHPKDVALALANAVNNQAAIGNTYFLGGGRDCQTRWIDFTNIIFGAIGINNIPADVYADAPYYTEHMDTTDAQQVLSFQHHTLADYRAEMYQKSRLARVLLWPLRPFIRRWICSLSPNKQ